MEGGLEEWERGRKKRRQKYIFMFTWMSALALIPPVAVVGKVKRGNGGTQSGRGGRCARVREAIQTKSEK